VKLLDFGIAKVLDPEAFPESDRTRTGVRLVTPEYASPEQVRGEAVTTASDVYQLGLLLFQLLAGRRPRLLHAPASPAALRETDRPSAAASAGTKPEEVDTAAATAPSTEEVAAARGTTPDRLRRQLEGDLDNIVAMALREDAARRYASVEQLAEDVRRHLDGLPVRARPETIGYLLSKFVRRHRVGVTASAALVVLAIAFVGSIVIQSRRVARERDRAQQMADLMIGMFTSIEPDVARGDTVTVLELLDRGVERGPRTLSGQPDLQATMLSTLAGVYSELGNPARAESLEEQSLALRRASFGREHPLTIVSLSRLGTFRTLRGDPSGAIPLFEEAEPLARRKFGPRHLETAHVLRGWGFALQVRGDYDAARRHTVEALAIYREQGDTALAELALTLNNLAWLHQVSGQLDSAEIRLRESLAIRRRILEPDHPELATSVAALADLLLRQGKLDEAEPLVNEELSIREKMLGRDHPDYAMSLKHQAWLFNARNDLDSAEQTYRGALDIQRRAYGNDHLAVADGLNQLAIFVKDRRGNPAAAEPLFREAVEINRRVRGDRALATAILRTNLAAALYVQRRYADAEPLYREALPVLDSLRPDDPDNGQVLVDYGEVLRNLGKHAEAEPLLRRALDIELRARSAGDWRILHRQGVLGACLLDQRRFADAEPYLLDSYNALMRERGLSNPFTRIALDRLIQLYTVWNRPAEAQRYRALIANR
jgi:serine/threonine-protein kinase